MSYRHNESGSNRLRNDGARGVATEPDLRGYALSTSNEEAAAELHTGPKSEPIPIHDSFAGYNGTPVHNDNIMAMAKRRGYLATPVSDDNLDPQNTRARFS